MKPSKYTLYMFRFLACGLLVWVNISFAQTPKADNGSSKALNYLSTEENELFRLINLARTEPKVFLTTYVKPYIETYDTWPSDEFYLKSLVVHLDSMKPLAAFLPDSMLWVFARNHATAMGELGKSGHDGADGTPAQKRLEFLRTNKGGNFGGSIAENCDYGNTEPVEILMHLLIDRGVPSLGHRKNILNPELHYIGLSIQPHITYGFNAVIDFASSRK